MNHQILEIESGAGFGGSVHDAIRSAGLEFPVVPVNTSIPNGEPGRSPLYAGKCDQNSICERDSRWFDDSGECYVVLENDFTALKLLFMDLDLDRGTDGLWSIAQVREFYGIDDDTFRQALFQWSTTSQSIHLLFRLSPLINDRVLADTNGDEYKNHLHNRVYSDIPAGVEFKSARGFYLQVRMKPGKRCIFKPAVEYPFITEQIATTIESSAQNQRNRQIMHQQEVRKSTVIGSANQKTLSSDVTEGQLAGYVDKLRRDNVDAILNQTANRKVFINTAAFTVGQYLESCQLNFEEYVKELTDNGLAIGVKYNRLKDIPNAIRAGMDSPKKPRWMI